MGLHKVSDDGPLLQQDQVAAHIADTPWTSVVTWAMDINADPSCRMTTDPDVVLGGSTGPEITMALGAEQAIQISVAHGG